VYIAVIVLTHGRKMNQSIGVRIVSRYTAPRPSPSTTGRSQPRRLQIESLVRVHLSTYPLCRLIVASFASGSERLDNVDRGPNTHRLVPRPPVGVRDLDQGSVIELAAGRSWVE